MDVEFEVNEHSSKIFIKQSHPCHLSCFVKKKPETIVTLINDSKRGGARTPYGNWEIGKANKGKLAQQQQQM